MSVLIAFLLAIAVADLCRGVDTIRRHRAIPFAGGAMTAGVTAWLEGLGSPADLVLLAVAVVALAGWVELADRAVRVPGSRSLPAAALGVLAAAVAILILASGAPSPVGGRVADWLAWTAVPHLPGLTPARALLVIAIVLIQLATGNLIVRLALGVGGALGTAADGPASRLKGGRMIGPMERLFILGLGLAGELTAAGVVVAAKGLIRWPELQAARSGEGDTGIHAVTEYFLVGSFLSWLVALGSLAFLLVT